MDFIFNAVFICIQKGINAAVVVISVALFVWRQRKIAREQYQRLAQRIGVTVV